MVHPEQGASARLLEQTLELELKAKRPRPQTRGPGEPRGQRQLNDKVAVEAELLGLQRWTLRGQVEGRNTREHRIAPGDNDVVRVSGWHRDRVEAVRRDEREG